MQMVEKNSYVKRNLNMPYTKCSDGVTLCSSHCNPALSIAIGTSYSGDFFAICTCTF